MIKNIINNVTLQKRLEKTIEYYVENYDVDPDVNEYMELAYLASKYIRSTYDPLAVKYLNVGKKEGDVYINIRKLADIIQDRLILNNLCDFDNPLYLIIREISDYVQGFNKISSTQNEANKKIASISLNILQEQRDSINKSIFTGTPSKEYKYKNKKEFLELCSLMQKADKDEEKGISPFYERRREMFYSIASFFDESFINKNGTSIIKKRRKTLDNKKRNI